MYLYLYTYIYLYIYSLKSFVNIYEVWIYVKACKGVGKEGKSSVRNEVTESERG